MRRHTGGSGLRLFHRLVLVLPLALLADCGSSQPSDEPDDAGPDDATPHDAGSGDATPDDAGSGDATPDDGIPPDALPPGRIVFVSSSLHSGILGGIAGADATCQELASAAGLPGTFMAWISDSTGSPATRFSRLDVPYVLVSGERAARSWDDLTDGVLSHAIDRDESGAYLERQVWTATDARGFGAAGGSDSCGEWLSTCCFSETGFSASIDATWTENPGVGTPCTRALSIYCFQQ